MACRFISGTGLALVALTWACGGSGTTSPSTPGSPLPPVATPTPIPTPIATCGSPAPAALYSFRMKVLNDQGFKKVLDSKPLVGRDAAYCTSIGQPGDICVARSEDAPDAIGCNYAVAGIASQKLAGQGPIGIGMTSPAALQTPAATNPDAGITRPTSSGVRLRPRNVFGLWRQGSSLSRLGGQLGATSAIR